MATSTAVFQKLMQITKVVMESKGFGQVHEKLALVAASHGDVTYKMEVCKEHLNLGNTLHGGLTATLVDHCSTMSVLSTDNPPGVSVDMNISYMRPAHLGDVITIQSKCTKTGKSLAFATVDIFNQDGKLIAQGKHTKYYTNN